MCLPQHGGSHTACQAQKPGTRPSSRERQKACLAEHRSMGQGRAQQLIGGCWKSLDPRGRGKRKGGSGGSRAQGMRFLTSQKYKRQPWGRAKKPVGSLGRGQDGRALAGRTQQEKGLVLTIASPIPDTHTVSKGPVPLNHHHSSGAA